MRLGAWLLSKGKITEDQLQRALQHREFFGGRIGSSLIALGYIDEDVLGAYLSDVAGTPYAPAARLHHVPPETIALVPARLAAQYRVIPISVEGRRLRLAMRDPRDLIALDEIAFMTGMTIEPFVSTDFRIQKALARYYQVAAPTEALPLAGGTASPIAATATSAPRPHRATSGSPGEVGFDGYPIDADPEQIDNPLLRKSGGVPHAAGETDAAAPNSLEEWRQAQEDIPDRFPEPATAFPSSPRLGSPAPALAAAMSPEPGRSVPRFVPPPASPVAGPFAAAPPASTLPDSPAPATSVAFPDPSAAFITPAPPASFSEALDDAAIRLQQADTRDGIFEVILGVVAARFRRAALFVVHADRVTGWSGRGPGLDVSRLRGVSVPFDRPSLFAVTRSGADLYHGPVSDLPANTRFFRDLGIPVPERVLVMSLMIKDRPTVVLYVDHGPEVAPASAIPDLRRLLAKAALALEILILRRKITTL